jgi:biopolymer transport protein ExbB
METSTFSVLELFNLGGIFMWPLLFFSVATIAISLERAIYLSYHNLRIDNLATEVCGYVKSGSYGEAREYLSKLTKRSMGSRILLALLEHSKPGAGFSEHRAERAAETEAMNCINSLENGFNFLTALGSLSPLTGFLGTVSGMIGAFRSIAEATEVNAQIVANGIYEALITTVFGLVIAIIAMIFHSIFSHIVDKFATSVERACSNVIALIGEQSEIEIEKEEVKSEHEN